LKAPLGDSKRELPLVEMPFVSSGRVCVEAPRFRKDL